MKAASWLILIACLTLGGATSAPANKEKALGKPAATSEATAKAETFRQPKTLAELLVLMPEQLEKVDISRIDLLCAEGLPGAEDLDIEKCIETLDEWARYVKAETERNYHRFVEHPEKFKDSSGRYRMAVMAAGLSAGFRGQY